MLAIQTYTFGIAIPAFNFVSSVSEIVTRTGIEY
jgi:hypothetical protein